MKKFLAAVTMLLMSSVAIAFLTPKGYVNDYANVMFAESSGIEHRISEYHKRTGVEIAVVTVKSLDGVSIEEYANHLFKDWGIGKKDKNNGLLILIAIEDRKTRIEVGYGLEGQLNDSFCGRVIQYDMIPQFKQKQFGRGVEAALTSIFSRLGK